VFLILSFKKKAITLAGFNTINEFYILFGMGLHFGPSCKPTYNHFILLHF